MGFLTPILLAGAALIAAPIILHLVMRRQPRQIEFPALQFVRQRQEANRRRLNLRHWLLLALRCALIAGLAVALARPTLKGSGLRGKEGAPLAVALVVDNALRMQYVHQNETRQQAATEMAQWLASNLPEDTQIAVMDLSRSASGFVVDAATADSRLRTLAPESNPRALEDAVREAIQLVAEREDYRQEVYLFSDLSAGAWNEGALKAVNDALAAAPGVQFYVVDVGVDAIHNYSLAPLELRQTTLRPGELLHVRAPIAAIGVTEAPLVELYLNDPSGQPVKRGQQMAELEADGSGEAVFELADLPLGTHQGYVQLAANDPLEVDNTRYFTVEVRPPANVLLLGERASDWLFLREALEPSLGNEHEPSRFRCTVNRFAEAPSLDFKQFDAVCLLDPPALSEDTWQSLVDYADQGGGLGIMLGHRARLSGFNEGAAQQLLPGSLKLRSRFATYLRPTSLDHPALAGLRDYAEDIPWQVYPVWQYWELGDLAGDAYVIARFANNQPAMLERTVGRGRVVTLTTPLSDPLEPADREPWNLLPTGPEPWPFLALSNQLVSYLAQSDSEQHAFLAGETVNLQLSPRQRVSSYALHLPSGESVRRTLPPGEDAIRISTSGELGNYRVASGGQSGHLDRGFSINAAPAVTELKRIAPEALSAALPPKQVEIARTLDDVQRYVDIGRSGRELFPWAIMLVAFVWGAEHLLANRFYRGGAMNTWGLEPVGGWWFVLAVAVVLAATLTVGPAGRKLAPRRRWILLGLRAGTAMLLLFVMLRPTLVTIETRKLPGSLVLMVDSSRSMQIHDAVGDKSRWNVLRESLDAAGSQLAELSESWDLKAYQFNEGAEPFSLTGGKAELPEKPDGPQSAIGSALDDVLQREARQRIVAVLLLSDGAQRAYAPRDIPPQTVARRLAVDQIPLYTFTFGKPALGLQSDVRVDDILANDVVFAETPTTIQAMVGADGYTNQTFKVHLKWENSEGAMEAVDTRQVVVESTKRRIPITLTHTPLTPGEYKVSVEIESPAGELVTTNNSQSTFVTVLKGGVNVLFLAGASRVGGGPAIEPRFIRAALAPHADINVRYELLNYRRERINIREQLREGKFDVYLLANVDVLALDDASWRQIAEDVDRGAGLGMLGGFHSFGPGGFRGSPLENVLPIVMGLAERQNFGEPPRQDMNVGGPIRFSPTELGGQVHPILQINDDSQADIDWKKLPPLDGANRIERSQVKPNAQVIAETADARRWPLLVVGAWGSGRTLALAIDSTWRWQMEGFGDVQRRFWRQVVLWLARKDDTAGQAVWVRLDGRRYQRGSRVEFAFGATNEQREAVADASFDVQVETPSGSKVAVRPTRRGAAFAGTFQQAAESGDYRVTVTATKDAQILGTAEARFTVPDRDMELDQPAAEPTLMASLASLTAEVGGAGLAPEELPELLDQLKNRTAEFEEEVSRKRSLWDTWPMFMSVVALLTGEWYLRKKWGLV